ncbi:MAG: prepilin-type N-terminal cleavage/methylation domain-containing protein, partial [Mollicutes bacterium]|nr:prepilin-type N-terminal cleavage/methylation domain-containing protein [Mollicutes bacterium]
MAKKGFTLIEILGVLVVLAIIIAISIPIITNILESARKRSFNSDAKLVLNAIRIQKDANPDLDETTISKSNLSEYKLSTEHYTSLTITKENDQPYIYIKGTNKWQGLKACGTYKDMNVYPIDELGVCVGDPEVLFIEDPNPGVICGNGTAEDYNNVDTCYIYTVEDLVTFSNMVNGTTGTYYTFLNKNVELMNDINITDDSTYGDSTTKIFEDINNNGTIEILKTELTTEEGFMPIGDNTNNFQGTFVGNAKTISNLYINKPTRQYTGLFGYNNGYIYGLNLVGINIEGNTYTGGITGYNNGNVSDIYLQGDVIANNSYAGGVVGYNSTNKNALSLLADVNVDGGTYSHVGGIIGYNYKGISTGVLKAGEINGTGGNIGKGYGSSYLGTANVYYSSDVGGIVGDINGTKYDSSLNDNLNG